MFDPAYQLLSPDSLASYIQQHQHLPGIPSAKKMQRNGMDVGEIQTVLLKKIEELTLYLLEQRQLIKKQQFQIQYLQQQMKSLLPNTHKDE